MTINTKFNIRDIIYLMHDNKVIREHITSILTETIIDHKGVIVTETRYKTNTSKVFTEDKIFSSKEELLATL